MTNPRLVGSAGDSSREAFGREMVDLASNDPTILVLDGDVAGGTGLHHVRTQVPEQFLQCGIAEQNMLGVASGLSLGGFKPVVATFASFFLRSIDQIRISVAYTNRDIKLVASHAGLDVGPDGASAQCLEDLAIMRSIPGITVVVPASPEETVLATRAILAHNGPVYMRTGRSPAPEAKFRTSTFVLGKAVRIREGRDITIVGCGPLLNNAIAAADALELEGVSVAVINMPTIKPLDGEALKQAANQTRAILTIEDHSTIGGLGSAVSEYVSKHYPIYVESLGMEDKFGESAEAPDLYRKYGLDAETISARLRLVANRAK